MSRLKGGSGVIDVPSMRISPDVGRSNPAIMRSVVVFPEPEAPRKVRNSPAAISSERSSTAVNASKRLVRCWSWRMGGMMRLTAEGCGLWGVGGGAREASLMDPPPTTDHLFRRFNLVPHFLILVAPRAPLPEVDLGAVLGDVTLCCDLLGC